VASGAGLIGLGSRAFGRLKSLPGRHKLLAENDFGRVKSLPGRHKLLAENDFAASSMPVVRTVTLFQVHWEVGTVADYDCTCQQLSCRRVGKVISYECNRNTVGLSGVLAVFI
jgi:hypothetical protein